MAMQIQLGTQRNIGTNDLANSMHKIVFAIIITFGNHRPVQAKHHAFNRHRSFKVGQNFIA